MIKYVDACSAPDGIDMLDQLPPTMGPLTEPVGRMQSRAANLFCPRRSNKGNQNHLTLKAPPQIALEFLGPKAPKSSKVLRKLPEGTDLAALSLGFPGHSRVL